MKERPRKAARRHGTASISIARWRSCNAYFDDYVKKNPDHGRRCCERNTSASNRRSPAKEYKVRHILVEKEDEAKELIAQLKKGGEFREPRLQEFQGPGLERPRRRSRLGAGRALREAVCRDDIEAQEGTDVTRRPCRPSSAITSSGSTTSARRRSRLRRSETATAADGAGNGRAEGGRRPEGQSEDRGRPGRGEEGRSEE